MRILGRLRERLSYANVTATVALFVALGGGTFAIAALKRNSVKAKQIAPNAVRSSEIKADAVTGSDALESSFGQVPSAANADTATNAETINGIRATEIAYKQDSPSAAQTIFEGSGLTLQAACTGFDISITATTAKQDSSIFASVGNPGNLFDHLENGNFDVGVNFDLLAGDDGNPGLVVFEYDSIDGSSVSGILNADENNPAARCQAYGHALSS